MLACQIKKGSDMLGDDSLIPNKLEAFTNKDPPPSFLSLDDNVVELARKAQNKDTVA